MPKENKSKKSCIPLHMWRTVTTTATYTQVGDTSKTTTTISTKTVEEYTGVRKK